MSAVKPLQNGLNVVIRVWSKSWQAVSCSVCLELSRLTSTVLGADVRARDANVNGFDGRCMSAESASGV